MPGSPEQIRALIEPVVADLGLELFDVEHAGGTLTVTVDRAGGIDLEAVAAATRAVSRALDEADPIAGRYTLEVSSPGLERPLRTPAHFAWAVGQKVTVKTRAARDGNRRFTGTLTTADDAGVAVALDEPAGEVARFAYDEIDKARTVFEWGPTPKPGGPKDRRGGAAGRGAGDAEQQDAPATRSPGADAGRRG